MYEQIEQKLLNQAVAENNIDKVCSIELAWGIILGVICAYESEVLSLEKADELVDIMDEIYTFSIDSSLKEMWEEWKENSL